MSLWRSLTHLGNDLLGHLAEHLRFQLPTEPALREWLAIIDRNVPLARGLTPDERERLARVARLLLDEVPFEGCDGVEITDEIRVTIAATAALLIHRLPYPRFTKLVRVLVYPDTFLPRRASSPDDSTIDEPEATLGQAWMSGVVVLSWAAVQRDAMPDARGNVVLHEMAHILDAEDGIFDGQPLYDDPAQGERWAAILDREFESHRAGVDAGEDVALSAYAARNHAEFFAVAAEAFFCTPEKLRERLPELYGQLGRFFRERTGSSLTS